MRRTLLIAALTLVVAAPAGAQQLKVSFNEGLVSVDASAVPVRQILAEWARQGGTRVVGVDRITGAPLTIKLINVPEPRALEVILRSVAGYMAAPRASGTGASIYDRILVMATSTPPPPPAAVASRPAAPNPGMAGTQRFVPPRQQPPDDDQDNEDDPNPPNPPVFTFPQQPGMVQPGLTNAMPPGSGQPMVVNPANGGAPNITINPAPPPGYPITMPVGSPTPGMINTPPPQPGQPVRPPGRQ